MWAVADRSTVCTSVQSVICQCVAQSVPGEDAVLYRLEAVIYTDDISSGMKFNIAYDLSIIVKPKYLLYKYEDLV